MPERRDCLVCLCDRGILDVGSVFLPHFAGAEEEYPAVGSSYWEVLCMWGPEANFAALAIKAAFVGGEKCPHDI